MQYTKERLESLLFGVQLLNGETGHILLLEFIVGSDPFPHIKNDCSNRTLYVVYRIT